MAHQFRERVGSSSNWKQRTPRGQEFWVWLNQRRSTGHLSLRIFDSAISRSAPFSEPLGVSLTHGRAHVIAYACSPSRSAWQICWTSFETDLWVVNRERGADVLTTIELTTRSKGSLRSDPLTATQGIDAGRRAEARLLFPNQVALINECQAEPFSESRVLNESIEQTALKVLQKDNHEPKLSL